MPSAAALTEDTRVRALATEAAAAASTASIAVLEAKVKPATTTATANTLGTVTRKLELFTPAGVSLGFVALYDAITTV
jgi:hypothetical protein